jgi:inorganic pyrophosphatase
VNNEFWVYLQGLVDSSRIVIDRPKDSIHPRYPGKRYPVDYGYLESTTSVDGGGVDIWLGSSGGRKVVGVLCTVDLLKRDTEIKIILDCTDDEIQSINDFINTNQMQAIYIKHGA